MYLSGCLLDTGEACQADARACLEPYLNALLSLSEAAAQDDAADSLPVYTAAYWSPYSTLATPSSAPTIPTPNPSNSNSNATLPLNLLITPSLPSVSRTASLIATLDEIVPSVEDLFWRIVGEEGRKEGVQFFAKEERAADGDDE